MSEAYCCVSGQSFICNNLGQISANNRKIAGNLNENAIVVNFHNPLLLRILNVNTDGDVECAWLNLCEFYPTPFPPPQKSIKNTQNPNFLFLPKLVLF